MKETEQLLSLLEEQLKDGGDFIFAKKEWTLYDSLGFPIASAHSIYGILVNLYFNRNKTGD